MQYIQMIEEDAQGYVDTRDEELQYRYDLMKELPNQNINEKVLKEKRTRLKKVMATINQLKERFAYEYEIKLEQLSDQELVNFNFDSIEHHLLEKEEQLQKMEDYQKKNREI